MTLEAMAGARDNPQCECCGDRPAATPDGLCAECEAEAEAYDADARDAARVPDNVTLRRQVEVLREAVQWYATEDHYKTDRLETGEDPDTGSPTFTVTSFMQLDRGKRARAALAATATDGQEGPRTAAEQETT